MNLNKVLTPSHAATMTAQGIVPNLLLQMLAEEKEKIEGLQIREPADVEEKKKDKEDM